MGKYIGNALDNKLVGGDDNDQIYGYGGNDLLYGNGGEDVLLGAGGGDFLNGGEGADFLNGGAGKDTADYSENIADVQIYLDHPDGDGRGFGGTAEGDHLVGVENIIGGKGADTLHGDGLDNVLTGGEGEDYLWGQAGNDQHFGGDDSDWMFGGLGNDHYDGGGDTDLVSYFESDAAVNIDLGLFTASGGFAQGDTLQAVEELVGSEFNDALTGDHQENTFVGLGGNDTLTGRAGDDGLAGMEGKDVLEGGLDDDYLDGGEGKDTASYRYAANGVSISIDSSLEAAGEAMGDQLFSIENLMGSEHNDRLGGDGGNNKLTGRRGDDTLLGRDGKDTLIGNQGADFFNGGAGADALHGGGGADEFYYGDVDHGGDTISDFNAATETFLFDSSAFGNLDPGDLDEGVFVANKSGAANNAGHRFIYETDTGILRFDADGDGAGAAVIIATLTGAPALSADNIFISGAMLS